MEIKNIYPTLTRATRNRRKMLIVLRWPFILSAIASVIVNFLIGGPQWSIVAAFSLFAVWNLFLSIDLVEYNRTSQSVKMLVYVSILLALIDIFITDIFAWFVIPLVCFGGLTVCIALFFSNFDKQKHNMLPLISFAFISVIASLLTLLLNSGIESWPFIILLGLSVLFLIVLIILVKQDFARELRKRFHF